MIKEKAISDIKCFRRLYASNRYSRRLTSFNLLDPFPLETNFMFCPDQYRWNIIQKLYIAVNGLNHLNSFTFLMRTKLVERLHCFSFIMQSITIQCLEALQFLHGLGLIHCDLKPENILVKSYSRCEVKVIDLGSSCFETDHLCSYVQSRSYRAPEVILGLPYDKRLIFGPLAASWLNFVPEMWVSLLY